MSLAWRKSEKWRKRVGATANATISKIAGETSILRSFVVAGFATRFAIHQTISADANIDHGLAQTTEFLTFAVVLGLLTLRASIAGGAGSSTHGTNLALVPTEKR
jgi:hypothetical protein